MRMSCTAKSVRVGAIVIAAVVAGCSTGGDEGASPADDVAPAAGAADAADFDDLDILNARAPLPGVVTGGQLTEAQFAQLAQRGYAFVSLRPVDEDGAGWEETYAEEHGIAFERIPVAGAAGVTRENAERLAALLDEVEVRGGRGTVVYCASGNRVGALFALDARFGDGRSPEAALELGRAAGLTRLEPHVRELLEAEE